MEDYIIPIPEKKTPIIPEIKTIESNLPRRIRIEYEIANTIKNIGEKKPENS
jgi:hypothetical protein